MNKPDEIKDKRAKYVQDVVNKSKSAARAVKKLSKELYLSADTIYRDLKK